MELIITQTDITQIKADALVVNLFEGAAEPTGAAGAANTATNGLVKTHIANHEFEGKPLDTLVLHSPAGLKTKHLIIIGLGKAEEFTAVIARQAAAKSIQKARELKAKTLATIVHGAGEQLDSTLASQMLAEGLLLGSYQFSRYKTKDKAKLDKQTIESVAIIASPIENLTSIETGLAKGEAIATAILNARDIINEPPSKIRPIHLARAAEEIARLSKQIKTTILDEATLKKEGYAALLAVASGSDEKPYLIHLHYRPANPKGSVALIGKGVTFDSGGLGIKGWNEMLSMKADMAGGGTVLGIFQALAELESIGQPIPIEVHGVIAATENMISGKALRPDDIIETKSGKTIEILHTDAEGRLILSDALTYATHFRPDYMLDFATLTGAAIRALGRAYAAVMGNNPTLMNVVKQASAESGELAWELPLAKEYQKYLESPVADLQNIASNDNAPGAIFGGLFLQEFVAERPWVHVDIAGPAWQTEEMNPVYPKGASGFGILLGLRVLELLVQKAKD